MLHDQSIVCFSSIDWDAAWQIHQEVMSRLARAGNRVLFVENTGVRRPALSDVPRLARRLRHWRSPPAPHDLPPNLRLLSPMIPPFPYSRLALPIKHALLGRSLRRHLRDLGMERPSVWVFLPTPLVVRLVRAMDPVLTIYYCADDFASSSPQAMPIGASEAELLQRADLVFATSSQLAERARHRNPRVYLMPAGVAFEDFERIRLSDTPLPPELQALPRPIVGYIGGVNERIDDELVVETARRLAGFSFVFVGPVRGRTGAVARCANMHLLGARAHEEIPRYIKGFDAAVIPYRVNAFTNHIYPVKLNEYLAMGVPVVSTNLFEVRQFVDEHPRAVAIAATREEFAAAIERAAGERDDEARERRIAIARRHGWNARLARMNELIEAALEETGAGRPPPISSRRSTSRSFPRRAST